MGCSRSVNMPSYVHETEENIVAVFVKQRTGLHAVRLCVLLKFEADSNYDICYGHYCIEGLSKI